MHQKLHIKPLAINRLFLEIEQQDTVDPELLRVSRLGVYSLRLANSFLVLWP
jgi:hypothetical protein